MIFKKIAEPHETEKLTKKNYDAQCWSISINRKFYEYVVFAKYLIFQFSNKKFLN